MAALLDSFTALQHKVDIARNNADAAAMATGALDRRLDDLVDRVNVLEGRLRPMPRRDQARVALIEDITEGRVEVVAVHEAYTGVDGTMDVRLTLKVAERQSLSARLREQRAHIHEQLAHETLDADTALSSDGKAD